MNGLFKVSFSPEEKSQEVCLARIWDKFEYHCGAARAWHIEIVTLTSLEIFLIKCKHLR